MKPQYEDVLISGTEGQIGDFSLTNDKSVFCIDWQAQGEATIKTIIARIPNAGLSYELTAGSQELIIVFKGRTAQVHLTKSLKDRFITLDAVNQILLPELEMRAFTVSFQADNTSIYIKPGLWWESMETYFPERMEQIFTRTEDILAMQEGRTPKKKPQPVTKWTKDKANELAEAEALLAPKVSEPVAAADVITSTKIESTASSNPASGSDLADRGAVRSEDHNRSHSKISLSFPFKMPVLTHLAAGPVLLVTGAFLLVTLLAFGITAFTVGRQPAFLLIPVSCTAAILTAWKKKLF